MSDDCLFCRIVHKEISVQQVYETETILAFPDINPQAPVHLLFIPKKHTGCLADTIDTHDAAELGHLFHGIADYTKQQDLKDFRIVINNGSGAGQTVFHLHIHLLSGRPFTWPPG